MEKKLIPNSTQTPNVIYDVFLPMLVDGELRCLLYICRRTYGFHRDDDGISLSQFVHGIRDKKGMKLDSGAGVTRGTAQRSLKTLAYSELVVAQKDEGKQSRYSLNLSADPKKVELLLKEYRKKHRHDWAKKPRMQRLFSSKQTVPTKDTGIVGGDEAQLVGGDETIPTSELHKRKGKKGKESNMRPAKTPSAHQQFMDYFYSTCQAARGIKPIITGKDKKPPARTEIEPCEPAGA